MRPRFQLIDLKMLLAIDAHWNLQGFARPFEALRIYREVVERGARFDVPEVAEVPKQPMPAKRYIHVGQPWDEQAELLGLRDLQAEFACGSESLCMGTRQTAGGRTILDVMTAPAFDFDDDSVGDFFAFEYDRILDALDGGEDFGPTGGYLYYARMGMLQLSSTAVSSIDTILRRTWWKHSQGLAGCIDVDDLIARSHASRQEALQAAGIAQPLAQAA